MRVAQIFFIVAAVFFGICATFSIPLVVEIIENNLFTSGFFGSSETKDYHEIYSLCGVIAFSLMAVAYFSTMPKYQRTLGKVSALMQAISSIIFALFSVMMVEYRNEHVFEDSFMFYLIPFVATGLMILGLVWFSRVVSKHKAMKLFGFAFMVALAAFCGWNLMLCLWLLLETSSVGLETGLTGEMLFTDGGIMFYSLLLLLWSLGNIFWFIHLILNAIRCGREASAAKLSEQVTPQVAATQGFAQPTSSAGFAAPATPAGPTTQQRLDELQRQIDELQRLKAQQEANNNPQSNE